MTSHGIDEKEKTRRASTADRPLIWKSVMTGVRAVARIRPEAIWPFSREFAVTTTHAIFDWGNKVTPLARKKRTKNKAARLQHDADRARIRTAFHGYDSEDVADPLESTKWRGHNPSRKQLALLQYFGIVEIPKNRGEASDWIDEKFKDPAMQQKTADWQFTRLIMHPEIYGQELSWFKSGLCNEMRAGVRYRVVGASGKLTSAKIASVVDALMRDDPWRPKSPNKFEIFFDRLNRSYPECCDGRSLDRQHSASKVVQARGSCLVMLSGCGVFTASVSALIAWLA